MEKEDLIRYQLDGFRPLLSEWECITPTAFMKDGFRQVAAEQEMVSSYLRAAGMMCEALKADNNPVSNHIKVFRKGQVCMPFLFLCRHALELALKERLKIEGKANATGHKLRQLYNNLVETQPTIGTNEDLALLVEVLDSIDDDGCKLRYSKDKNGTEYQDKPVFIMAENVIKVTKEACNYLRAPEKENEASEE